MSRMKMKDFDWLASLFLMRHTKVCAAALMRYAKVCVATLIRYAKVCAAILRFKTASIVNLIWSTSIFQYHHLAIHFKSKI